MAAFLSGSAGSDNTNWLMTSLVLQDIHKFVAKIGNSNIPSQRLFYKLAFRETSRSKVFNEITFTLVICEEVKVWLRQQLAKEDHFEAYDKV